MSFFSQCEKCGASIARGMLCPCGAGAGAAAEGQESVGEVKEAFAARRATHLQNYMIYMCLMVGVGLLGLITAVLWGSVIFGGNVGSLIWIMLVTVITALLGAAVAMSKTMFPVDLHCPGCNTRIDELGLNGDQCPICHVQLR